MGWNSPSRILLGTYIMVCRWQSGRKLQPSEEWRVRIWRTVETSGAVRRLQACNSACSVRTVLYSVNSTKIWQRARSNRVRQRMEQLAVK